MTFDEGVARRVSGKQRVAEATVWTLSISQAPSFRALKRDHLIFLQIRTEKGWEDVTPAVSSADAFELLKRVVAWTPMAALINGTEHHRE